MKSYLILGLLFLQNFLYSQTIKVIYEVEITNRSESTGIPSINSIVLKHIILNDLNGNLLIETLPINPNKATKISSNSQNKFIINLNKKTIHTFNNEIAILESNILAEDTLINTGISKKIHPYKDECQIYHVKGKPNILIYCNKKLEFYINPGIRYFSKDKIGGIVLIENKLQSKTITYKLVNFTKSNEKFDNYLVEISTAKMPLKKAISLISN